MCLQVHRRPNLRIAQRRDPELGARRAEQARDDCGAEETGTDDKERATMTTMELLRLRYPAQSYALFAEVQSATAYQGKQRADAVAVGLWPSRGLDVIGFEFKAYRGDWLRELKQPEKAEEIFQFCDRWYLVADEHTAHSDEIPATWGWLVPGEKGLREAKAAPVLQAKPLERIFVASLLRSAQKDRDNAIQRPLEKMRQEVRSELAEEFKKDLDELRTQIRNKELEYRVSREKIETALGINFSQWGVPLEQAGAALRLIVSKPNDLRMQLGGAREKIKQLLEDVEQAEKDLAGWPETKVTP
jgi:hypothetical protein